MSIYDRIEDIHYWGSFNPLEPHYLRYSTNVVFACIKIVDVYQSLCVARSNLHFLDNNDYGDFAKDRLSIKFIKSILIQTALINYNICIDLSWQVLWLYFNYKIEDRLPTNILYDKCIRKCTYDELRLELTLAKQIKLRDYYIVDFNERPLTKEVREKYNYLKHRGTFYFEDLGINDSSMNFSVNGKRFPMVNRIDIDIEFWKEKLISFDIGFVKYFNEIIKSVVPKDFSNNSFNFADTYYYYMKHKAEIDKL